MRLSAPSLLDQTGLVGIMPTVIVSSYILRLGPSTRDGSLPHPARRLRLVGLQLPRDLLSQAPQLLGVGLRLLGPRVEVVPESTLPSC